MSELQTFTICYSNHPLGMFFWLFHKHRIGALVDVRRYPASLRHPYFSREPLSASLEDESIEYNWLDSLGR